MDLQKLYLAELEWREAELREQRANRDPERAWGWGNRVWLTRRPPRELPRRLIDSLTAVIDRIRFALRRTIRAEA